MIDGPMRLGRSMFRAKFVETFAGRVYGTETRIGVHTRSVKRAVELAKKAAPLGRGDASGTPVLMEFTITKDNVVIHHEWS